MGGSSLLRTWNLSVAIISARALAFTVGTEMHVIDFADGTLVRVVGPEDDADAILVELGVEFA